MVGKVITIEDVRRLNALADALDALKAANKGCGGDMFCVREGVPVDTCKPGQLCTRCKKAREAAITSLTRDAE